MRAALAYRPRPGPLQAASPLAAVAFLGVFATVAFVTSNPVVLAGAGAAVWVAGIAAGAGRALRVAARFGLTLGIAIVLVNAVAVQRGDTTLIRGWDVPVLGQIDVTLEALAAGGILALRILVVVAAFAVYSACVDPDRVLRDLRPIARRSALTATLVSRAVPLAAADLSRLREAAALRGPAAAAATRAALARRLVAGSLDRSVDAAATLELRGYGARTRPGGRERHRSRHDRTLFVIAAATALAATVAVATGAGSFEAYPILAMDTDAATVLFAAALPLLAAIPFTAARARGRIVRRRRPEVARA